MLSALEHWERDGFVHLPELIADDVRAQLAVWADEISSGDDSTGYPGIMHHWEATETGNVLARSENFARTHAGIVALTSSGSLLDSGAELLGESLVLYKEKLNHKLPGGAGFAPHQDATAYKFVDRHVTCMIAIDDATVANGCLELAAGHHGSLLPTDGDGCIEPSVAQQLGFVPVEMQRGDVLWFDSRAPHRSGPNTSSMPRRALFLTFNSAAQGDLRDAYYADKRSHLAQANTTTHSRVSTIGHFQGLTPLPTDEHHSDRTSR